MALQPVNRRSVPEDVFEQILADVLSGEMQPGETLPSERRLAEVLGVSRPAVREALKRVSAAGLVEVRQGDATTVRDFRGTRASTCSPDCCSAAANSTSRSCAASSKRACTTDRRPPSSPRCAVSRAGSAPRRCCRQPGVGDRPGRAPTSRADVLGPRRRRRRFHRVPADVQHASVHIRTRAACSRRGDGRRGRPSAGLSGTRRHHRGGQSRSRQKAAMDLLEPATAAMLAVIASLEEKP